MAAIVNFLLITINIFCVSAFYTETKKIVQGNDVWQDAVVPFYISDDFDSKHQLLILTTIMEIASRTCVKFLRTMTEPASNERVVFIENPNKIQNCNPNTTLYFKGMNHKITLGKDCLRTPQLKWILFQTLGFSGKNDNVVLKYIDDTYKSLCEKRDQQNIKENCDHIRYKRDTETENQKEKEITPKQNSDNETAITNDLIESLNVVITKLNLSNEFDEIAALIKTIGYKTLQNARQIHCNTTTKPALRQTQAKVFDNQKVNDKLTMINFAGSNFIGNIFQKVLSHVTIGDGPVTPPAVG